MRWISKHPKHKYCHFYSKTQTTLGLNLKKSPNGFIGYDVNLQNTPVSEIGKYFHMNLGWWAGASNGWYRYDTYMQNEETNFDKEQTMLTIKLK